MSESPILFSAPMIRAILDGAKTMTRRMAKVPEWATVPKVDAAKGVVDWYAAEGSDRWVRNRCPYGKVGDVLWCREAWQAWFTDDGVERDWKDTPQPRRTQDRMARIVYCAADPKAAKRWVTPLFMPRWASRITLRVTGIRVERLHTITEADATAEGVEHYWSSLDYDRAKAISNVWSSVAARRGWGKSPPDYRGAFGALWHEINGEASWNADPFVWVVEFERV